MSEGNRPITGTKNKKLPQGASMAGVKVTAKNGNVMSSIIDETTDEKIENLAKDLMVSQVKPGYPATIEMAQQAVKTAKAFYEALEKKE